jgi:hypothetical protein
VPIYLTRELDKDVSTDLFRNMALYNEMAIKFKQMSDIEAQARLLVSVERNKKAIATSRFGKTQINEKGELEYTPDNTENTQLLDEMVRGIVYGQKYLESESFDQLLGRLGNFGEKINDQLDKLGVKSRIFPENLASRQFSVNKVINQINNTFQNINTSDTNSRNYFNVVAGNVTTSIQSIHNDHSYIATTNNLYFQVGSNIIFQNAGSPRMTITSGGNVGIGTTNPSDKLQIVGSLRWGSTTNNLVTSNDSGGVYMELAGTTTSTRVLRIQGINDAGNRYSSIRLEAGAEQIVFTTADTTRMTITNNGTVQPGANGTQDLGTSSLRWGTVFTSDLSLSNGIGDYTIVEGENDLFLYNNKQNKVYKFMLAEVNPADATPKKS